MIKGWGDIFKIPELKKRLLFTLGLLAVYRLGVAISLPGVNSSALMRFFEAQKGTLFGFIDMFSGGALGRMSVCALGIMPYINASIIMSLLTAVVPQFEALSKEGESGRKKLTQYTRWLTLFIGTVQAFGLTFWIQSLSPEGINIVLNPGMRFQLMSVLTLVTGTVFLMWIGEQITEKGVGNGISLIIFTGIIVRLPSGTANTFRLIRAGELSLFLGIAIAAVLFLILAAVVWVEQAQRRVPVQYAKRVVGRKIYGGQSTYLPLRVDQSGVIAVIFAMSLMMFPATIGQFFPKVGFISGITSKLAPGEWLYTILFAGLIIFFCYFYTAITFNPQDLADNMKKYGGFIPGIRAGTPTAQHIDHIITRITLGGALFVVLVALMPDYFRKYLNIPFYFGGTALLIIVGVGLDTMGQLESHLLMRHYEGFIKKGKFRGRYFNIK